MKGFLYTTSQFGILHSHMLIVILSILAQMTLLLKSLILELDSKHLFIKTANITLPV